jgi:hypothetical protein
MPRLRFKKGCGLFPAFQSIAESMQPLTNEWLRSGETSLKKIGAPELAKDMLSMRTQAEIKAGGLVADYHENIKGMSKPEFDSLMGVIQGTGRAINPRVANAARAEVARLNKVQAQLGKQTTNIDPVTIARADKAMLSDYYTDAARKIEEFNAFGERQGRLPQDVRVELDILKNSGGDYRTGYLVADAYFNPARLTEAQQALWDKFAGFEVATKLGLSTISNATQPVNVALVTGNMTLLKSLAKEVTNFKSAEDFALRAGSILSSVTHESQISSGVSPSGFSGKMMEYNGFSPVEVHNRIVASMAGAEHAVNMFKRLKRNSNDPYARRHLSYWLGLDPDVLVNQSRLTQEQIHIAAHTLTDRTQFRTTAMETPPSWGSTLTAKMIFLFKNFAFNQSKFMYTIARNEVLAGNLRPLIPLLTTIPMIGYLADKAKRFASGAPDPKTFWEGILGAYSAVGGFGIISDMAARAAVGQLANSAIGPIFGDAVDLIQSPYKGTKADPLKDIKKQVVRRIPVVGRRLSHELYPSEKKAQ